MTCTPTGGERDGLTDQLEPAGRTSSSYSKRRDEDPTRARGGANLDRPSACGPSP